MYDTSELQGTNVRTAPTTICFNETQSNILLLKTFIL